MAERQSTNEQLNLETEKPNSAEVFLHMLKDFYNKHKKTFDRIFYIILFIAIVVAIYINNQKKKQEQVESLAGQFFIKMYENKKEEMYSIGELIKEKYIGKNGTAVVLFIMGNKYLEDNKRNKAIEVFESIVNNYTKETDLVEYSLSKLAYLYTYTDEDKAIVSFKRLINNYQNSPLWGDWNIQLAKLYMSKGSKDLAKEICLKVVDNNQLSSETRLEGRKILTLIDNLN